MQCAGHLVEYEGKGEWGINRRLRRKRLYRLGKRWGELDRARMGSEKLEI